MAIGDDIPTGAVRWLRGMGRGLGGGDPGYFFQLSDFVFRISTGNGVIDLQATNDVAARYNL